MPSFSRHLIYAGALSAGLVTGLPALAAPAADTVVIAQSVDAPTLDPAQVSSTSTENILGQIFVTLQKRDNAGKLHPYLATEAKKAADGLSVTYTIREGMTCQDGSPLTADDVAYSFERAADPKNGFTGNLAGYILPAVGFKSAEALDPTHVRLDFTKVNPIAVQMLSEAFIECRESYENMSLDQAAQKPVGSGPYKMVEWDKDDHITLERWDGFKLATPKVKTEIWKVIPEASTRSASLIAGDVDIATNISPDQKDAIDNSGSAKVKIVSGTRRIFVGMNLGQTFADTPAGKALADPKVRQALQYAVDVPAICSQLLNAPCDRATSPVNPPNENKALKPYPYDPKKAEALLDAAGYPAGKDGVRFEVTLESPKGRYLNDSMVAQAVGQYLSDVGVKTDVKIEDFGSVFVPKLMSHKAGPLYLLGSGGVTYSPLSDLMDFSSPEAATNYGDWHDPEFFAKWKDIAATNDPAKQKEIADEMQKIFYERGPWILMYFQPDFYGVSDRIEWSPRRDELIDPEMATIIKK